MGRTRLLMLFYAAGLAVSLGGCQSTGSNPFATWPWMNQTAQKEEYKVPPMEDARYTDAQSFPKETLQASIRNGDGEDATKPGGTGRGLVGPMRQSTGARY